MPTRKSYAGGAVPTTISSGSFGIGSTACTVNAVTGWPTTAGGPFVASLDRGLATEEHVLVAARSGTSLSSITRGYDGTSEVAHGPNATIEHRWDAVSADEANRIASLLTTKGDLPVHDGTQPQREPVGPSGYYYTATPAAATGHSWTAPVPSPATLVTTKGDLLLGSASGILARFGVGANGQRLGADSTQTLGVGYDWYSIPVFTTATARDAAITVPVAGMMAHTNDTHTTWLYTTVWTVMVQNSASASYAPTPTFGGAATAITGIVARWSRIGRRVSGSFVFSFTGAPNAGGFAFSLPVGPDTATDGYPLGDILMSYAGGLHFGIVVQNGTGGQCIGYGQGSALQSQITGIQPGTPANSDFFRMTFAFDAAAD